MFAISANPANCKGERAQLPPLGRVVFVFEPRPLSVRKRRTKYAEERYEGKYLDRSHAARSDLCRNGH